MNTSRRASHVHAYFLKLLQTTKVMDDSCLELTLTFYCATSHCHPHASPCDIRALYIHSRQSLAALSILEMHACLCVCAFDLRFQLLFPASYLGLCVCVCVIINKARCNPLVKWVNPGANVDLIESLSEYDCLFLLLALVCGVPNAAWQLHCYRVLLKMLLQDIQLCCRKKTAFAWLQMQL